MTWAYCWGPQHITRQEVQEELICNQYKAQTSSVLSFQVLMCLYVGLPLFQPTGKYHRKEGTNIYIMISIGNGDMIGFETEETSLIIQFRKWNILVFSCYCNKLLQTSVLKQYKFIILQFCRLEIRHRSQWAKIKGSAGLHFFVKAPEPLSFPNN